MRWGEFPLRLKVLAILAVPSFCVFAASLVTTRAIETAALSQPMTGGAVFRHPRSIKNEIHFLADWQESVLVIARPTLLAAFVITAILFVALTHWQSRIEKEKKRQALDRVAASLDSPPHSAI
jgi:hypothetical protein